MKSRIIFLRIILIVAACELAVMILLGRLGLPEGLGKSFLDAGLLALGCALPLYLWVVRVYRDRKRAEEALRQKNVELAAANEELATAEEELRSQVEELVVSREALKKSEELYRSLFDNMLNGFAYCRMLYDQGRPQDFVYLGVNSAFEALTGLKDIVGKKVSEAIPGIRESDPELFEIYGRVASTGKPERFETYVEALKMWFAISVYSPQKEHFVAVFDVITERKRGEEALRRKNEELSAANEELAATEEELRNQVEEILTGRKALEESERKYRNLVDNALVGVYQTTLAGEILYANEALVRMLEFDTLEALMAAGAWARYKDPQSRKDFLEALNRDGRITNFETEILTQKGETCCVLMSTAVDGNTLSGMVRDVTERKRLEAQVLQSQKMEAIGSLAGGVAHDFNNILMAIMSYSELLVMKLDDGPLRGYAEGIQQSVEKAASLTQRLLTFSRKEVTNPYVLALNEVVADAEKMFRRLIGEDIELVIRPAPDAGRVKADPVQLEQVIMNLAVNARDAMPQGGRLFIQTANAVLDESDARLHPNAAPGRYVQLSVSDTGCGMDAATQARIFEPFFTTKEKGKGTGLGLSTVYGIIHQSGGFIELESAPGKGARFKVYLPRVEEEAGPTPKSAVNSELARGSETVLLVEDEPEILNLVNEILSGKGYTVLQAGTGDLALRLAERHAGPIHLLLTDVVMPGMSGRVLAERLTSLRPDVRVIYTSGYTDDAILRHGLRTEGLNFIQKPFRPDALLHKVREVLNAPGGVGV